MNVNDLPSTSKFVAKNTEAVGANWATFDSAKCTFARLHNPNAVTIDVRRDGAGDVVTIPAYGSKTFFGVYNLNVLSVRRTDQSNTQVSVQGEALS